MLRNFDDVGSAVSSVPVQENTGGEVTKAQNISDRYEHLTRPTRAALAIQINKIRKEDPIPWETMSQAADLWYEARWNGTRPPARNLSQFVEQVLSSSPSSSKNGSSQSLGKKAWVGPKANFKGKHYETLAEFREKQRRNA
jgi:hypothetical protein